MNSGATYNSEIKSPLLLSGNKRHPVGTMMGSGTTSHHKTNTGGNSRKKQSSMSNAGWPQMTHDYSSKNSIPSFREDENEKLNTLIEDYRRENERCSQKIQELQEKLNLTSTKFKMDT
jgi:hypothetical protein